MTDYEKDLDAAYQEGLDVKEKYLKSDAAALIKGNRVALNKNFLKTSNEKASILAEERGHYNTSVGNILNLSIENNRKQEYAARLWGYNNKIGLMGIISAFEQGCQAVEDAADFLGVTEDYFRAAVECYREKYGLYVTIDNYVIRFIPSIMVYRFY